MSYFSSALRLTSILGDLCKAYKAAQTPDLPGGVKACYVWRGFFACTQAMCFGSSAAGNSLNTQEKFKALECFAAGMNAVVNPLKESFEQSQSGANGGFIPVFEALIQGIMETERAKSDLECLQERKHLGMSDEEMTKLIRETVVTRGEHGIVVKQEPITRPDCESRLRSATSSAKKADVMVLALQHHAVSRAISMVSELVDFMMEFRISHQQNAQQEVGNLQNRDAIPSQFDDDPVLSQYVCPINRGPIRHPIIDPTTATRNSPGTLYERAAITRWVLRHHISPLSGRPLEVADLLPAPEIEREITARLEVLQAQLDVLAQ